jgi:hypothetical protein
MIFPFLLLFFFCRLEKSYKKKEKRRTVFKLGYLPKEEQIDIFIAIS